jgi:hypothetical protein
MLKNIFFPQKIGINFLSSQKFSAFYLDSKLTIISGKNEKNKIIINQINHQTLTNDINEQIRDVNNLVDPKNEANIILVPDHLVLYRKLQLPLTDRETIKNIIEFEVGPTLPFEISQSNYDFFVIPHSDKKYCTVWIIFILKQNLINYLEPFDLKNIIVTSSLPGVIDLIFSLNIKDTYVVCYQNGNVVTILICENKLLKDVVISTLENLDINIDNLKITINKNISLYWFGEKNIKTINEFQKLNSQDFKNIIINSKNKIHLPLTLIAASLRSNYGYEINLLEKENFTKLNLYQLLISGFLVLTCLTIIIGHLILNHLNFKSIEKKSLQEVKKELNRVGIDSKKNNLALILKEIEKSIKNEESIWYAFSNQKRFSYLLSLSELTKQIDRSAIDLKIKKLSISPNLISLEASVKDFPSLQLLEEEINESKYLKTLTPLQETSFNLSIKVLQDGAKA